jgi:hypothetical protein
MTRQSGVRPVAGDRALFAPTQIHFMAFDAGCADYVARQPMSRPRVGRKSPALALDPNRRQIIIALCHFGFENGAEGRRWMCFPFPGTAADMGDQRSHVSVGELGEEMRWHVPQRRSVGLLRAGDDALQFIVAVARGCDGQIRRP